MVTATPWPLYPRGKTRYPLYRGLRGTRGRRGRVRKILPPPGFDPRTVQSVASRYTDCAIPAHAKEIADMFYVCPVLCPQESSEREVKVSTDLYTGSMLKSVAFHCSPANRCQQVNEYSKWRAGVVLKKTELSS